MTRVKITWVILGCTLFSQHNVTDYPDWFLNPPKGEYVIGLSKNVSNESVTLKNAYLDALSMHELLQNGAIRSNAIASRARIADSLGISLGSRVELPDSVELISCHTVGDLYCGLFCLTYEKGHAGRVKTDSDRDKITAVGKQTIHPDRIYESWASAEIEAFKELSRIKKSRVESIIKKDVHKTEKLIYLQSNSNFSNARIVRRWIEKDIAHVEVSDTY